MPSRRRCEMLSKPKKQAGSPETRRRCGDLSFKVKGKPRNNKRRRKPGFRRKPKRGR